MTRYIPWTHPANAWKKNETTAMGNSAPDMVTFYVQKLCELNEAEAKRSKAGVKKLEVM
jgi:hypothetical protein